MSDPNVSLVFDPFAGASGDMILAGLLDIGLPLEWLKELVDSLPLEARIHVDRTKRGSLVAAALKIDTRGAAPLRQLPELLEIVDAAPVGADARRRAASVMTRLGDVEADLHGVAVEDVHFHEVGAADTFIDVLGCCAGLAELGIRNCYTRPVALGRGTVVTEHGTLPLPAPATLRLLEGLSVFEPGYEGELTTPTGAALLAELTGGRRPPASFAPLRSGYGAGSRDPDTHANVIRLVLVKSEGEGELFILQCDIDDMLPEYVPPLLERLYEAGATDVFALDVAMKKGRRGVRVEVLAPGGRRAEACRMLLEESTTLGVRYWPVQREVLPRETKTIKWRGFSIRVKTSVTPDGHIRQKPEYDDVLQIARSTGLPVLRVRELLERELDFESQE